MQLEQPLTSQVSIPNSFSFDIEAEIEKPNQNYFEQNWQEIEYFLKSIYESEDINSYCFQHFYDMISSICDNEFDELLFKKLEEFYRLKFYSILNNIAQQPEDFINKIEKEWIKINRCLVILSEIFKQFEGSYLYKTKTPSFDNFILKILSDQFNEQFNQLLDAIITSLLDTFRNIRDQNPYNHEQLKNLMGMIIKIGSYENQFKSHFFDQSNKYYLDLQKKHRANFDLRVYLAEIEHRLQQETGLIEAYLSKATGKILIDLIQKHLIAENLETIFSNGFDDLLNKRDYQNLQRLFHNMSNIDKLDFLKKNWNQFIRKKGEEIVNEENQDDITQHLLDFFHDLDLIIQKCFENCNLLKQAKNYALEHVLSIKVNTIAELTSKHIDTKLKKQNKTMQDHDSIEKDVDDALELFRYLPAKDIFEAFYNKRLARRLLMNLAYSYELERKVLDRLRSECGDQYTMKADEILKDVNESKQLNKDFNDYLSSQGLDYNKKNIFSCIVVSSSAWPMKNQQLPILFEPFDKFQKEFKKFYELKHKGVCINWQHETSTCDIQGNYNKEKYIFQVQLIQGLILLCFNRKNKLSYTEIHNLIQIDEEELKKNLVSLYAMKDTQKLLNKSGEPKRVDETDIFEVNEAYQSKKKLIKVNSIFKKETKEDVKETTDRVLTERGFVLDASIVKILKSKKNIYHQELMKELFNDLMLPINATEVKKRIEGLIEREYMKRDPENHSLYHYVA
ncbi:hypothetical protein ABPG72_012209 [Tetrahymena utriculariae]